MQNSKIEIGNISPTEVYINPKLTSEQLNHVLVRCADMLRARAELKEKNHENFLTYYKHNYAL